MARLISSEDFIDRLYKSKFANTPIADEMLNILFKCDSADILDEIIASLELDKSYSENEEAKEDIDEGIIIGLQMAIDTINKYRQEEITDKETVTNP